MKNKLFWINVGYILFLLLFAFEPIIAFSDVYFWIMPTLATTGFIALVGFIIGVFKKKISIQNGLIKEGNILFVHLFVSILGIIISYTYQPLLLNFWIFILVLSLLRIFLEKPLKRR
ncbi:hypothetical protein KZX59_08740 [Prevotella intermedia]|nr:hypothetical protein [Prevotella intermedia]